jgi:hypothetical protein
VNVEDTKVALHEVHGIFDRHALPVWLDCGTLLGAVRDGDVIPWDNDIDLGMWTTDLDAADKGSLWREINSHDFEIYRLDDKLVLDRRGVPVNISLFYKDGDLARRVTYPAHAHSLSKAIRTLWWVTHARRQVSDVSLDMPGAFDSIMKRLLVTGYAKLPAGLADSIESAARSLCKISGFSEINWCVSLHHFDVLKQMQFLGDQWSVPSDTEEYLRFRYGLNWRVPNRNWSTLLDDGAVQR